MPTLSSPTNEQLAAMVQRHRDTPFSYEPGLLAREGQVRHWFVDRHDESVGHGEADFLAACASLRDWAKFRQPWIKPALPLAQIEIGEMAGYSARVLHVWWSYCCRIIAVIDQTDDDGTRRFGFDYGTVKGHAERGEERFLVTMTPDGDVHFSLFAISRPGRWFTWIGLPLARRAQSQFRPGAAAAVRAAVEAARMTVKA
ncbi:MAG: hypothetical protein JWN99_3085 [Ilumatobacteraceae bacterium]|nr:hypothetical protein [Ilumatobacteraceae bacterium]